MASAGGIVIGEKDGKASLQIDGDYYGREGASRLAYASEIPTNTNQLTNGAGFITGITKSMVTTALGYTPPTSDTNTHYTTRIYAGASGTAANASASDPYVKITDDNTYRNQIRIVGSGATSVSSDASGNITISSTDTNTNTTYAAGTGVTISGSNNAINVTYGSSANTACQGNDSRLSDARPASDVYAWAKASTKPSYVTEQINISLSFLSLSKNFPPSYLTFSLSSSYSSSKHI